MKELSRERYIITGHDQFRADRVVYFRRRLPEGVDTLEELEVHDAERAEANPAMAPIAQADLGETGPRDERITTNNRNILADGTVFSIIKGYEVETATPLASKRAKKRAAGDESES